MKSVKLPKTVTVYRGPKSWRGEIPPELCPARYLPGAPKVKPPRKKKVKK